MLKTNWCSGWSEREKGPGQRTIKMWNMKEAVVSIITGALGIEVCSKNIGSIRNSWKKIDDRITKHTEERESAGRLRKYATTQVRVTRYYRLKNWVNTCIIILTIQLRNDWQ